MQQDALISLDDARELVTMLEQGQVEQANQLIQMVSAPLNQQLFDEVGKLTRQLHSALQDFHLDDRISDLAKHEIPDAKERLNYVIEMTEQAANRTMDALDESMPKISDLQGRIQSLQPGWEKLMQKQIELGEFKTLCHEMNAMMTTSAADAESIKNHLNQVMMAQDFQDLTGQVIRRVIDLVREVEENLVSMLTVFGEKADVNRQAVDTAAAEGPVVSSENKAEVVNGQDEVDDLLSSLGF
ncbi:protein phosphatase CheZ [Ferrimonas sediminicola]|uniref:Protein phosphatase CheZ n=1 Tax=Ferrimonas sediminicola TaxID=2569538 RepID=A0A4U1B9R3_9GAMM|nr:protein phosphatase CheZ [Ferrimonas sediminicola]TKB47224.1 protein phosphatase CheZ [Ferrimonas sediminicola]